MRLSLNQRGVSNVIFPLVILAAIGLGVYLVQQQTDITPSAQELNAPSGCEKIKPVKRFVRYKNCSSSSENCNNVTNLIEDTGKDGEDDKNPDFTFDGKKVATYPLKETVWEFDRGWRLYETKGPRQSDGDRTSVGKPRFDVPGGGKGYHETDSDPHGDNREGYKVEYGSGVVVEIAYSRDGTNFQGLPGKTYDYSRSYALVPTDPNSNTKCSGAGTTGTKSAGETCDKPSDCKSGVCTNRRCAERGNKVGGASCNDGVECQSGSCSNNKCEGGSRTTSSACDRDSDCASNNCVNNRCVTAQGRGSSGSQCSSGSDCASGTCTNNKCTTPSPSPLPSRSPSPSPAASASPSPSASPAPSTTTSASPAPSGTPTVISLTKAEIIGFRNSYNALDSRLGTASQSGNMKITANIAKSELDSIVNQLPQCLDDTNVGTCLDQRFRTRFDFAKTAARLTAFYAIFNNVAGICVKSDFGLNPLITATSQNNTSGRVNLCSEPSAAQKIWRIFVGGKFEPILQTDTRWPANPSCAALPQDVSIHYRNAEKLFENQPGFLPNTACDGKTAFEPPGGITP